jgi:hypothetical protein
MLISSKAYPVISAFILCNTYEILSDKADININININIRKYKKLIISTDVSDLIWLQDNKENLHDICIILVVLNNEMCIKIGKNISHVLYFNDSDTYEENLAKFNNAVNNVVIMESLTTQKICIIGGCYRYGVMTWFTKLEEYIRNQTEDDDAGDDADEIEMFIVKYEGYNYCVLSFILSDKISFDIISETALRYNFKLVPGVPKSNESMFPLHCPSDSCYTVQNIISSEISDEKLAEMLREELQSLLLK